jgi:hypothetical protein
VPKSADHEALFKDLRLSRKERASSYPEALLGRGSWFKQTLNWDTEKKVEVPQVPSNEIAQTLKSLEKLALDHPEGINFPGGELALTEEARREVAPELGALIVPGSWPIKMEPVQVVFVGERPKDADNAPGDMLGRMIVAMKLAEGSFVRYELARDADEQRLRDEAATFLASVSPRIVVAMGAIASNILLGKKERLSKIHGQEFPLTLSSESSEETHGLTLVPLFHPDFLAINPNMKRAAWEDLQKVMSLLAIA